MKRDYPSLGGLPLRVLEYSPEECSQLAVAVENVDQLTVTEHALVHDLLTYENRAEILRDATRVRAA